MYGCVFTVREGQKFQFFVYVIDEWPLTKKERLAES